MTLSLLSCGETSIQRLVYDMIQRNYVLLVKEIEHWSCEGFHICGLVSDGLLESGQDNVTNLAPSFEESVLTNSKLLMFCVKLRLPFLRSFLFQLRTYTLHFGFPPF